MTPADPREPDDPSPFDHIVDDETPRIESTDWASAQIEGGRTPEDVAAELVASGWSPADAEEICETARLRTRHIRGATSREDVARAHGVGDPNVMRNVTPFAKPSPFAAFESFIRAFLRFRSTKDIGRRKR